MADQRATAVGGDPGSGKTSPTCTGASARKWFTGPLVQGSEEEPRAIEMQSVEVRGAPGTGPAPATTTT